MHELLRALLALVVLFTAPPPPSTTPIPVATPALEEPEPFYSAPATVTPAPILPTAEPPSDVPDVVSAFRAGYTARGGNNPAVMSYLDHITGPVMACESDYRPGVVNQAGPFYGLMQFTASTWAGSASSPTADWSSPWEQGWATADLVEAHVSQGLSPGSSSGWPVCWWS